MDLTVAIFLLVYLAMGLGYLPGTKVDRTGAAIIGAMALLASGRTTPATAWAAIDYRTIGMLFGLMVVSSAFAVSGFYAFVAQWVGSLRLSPPLLLAVLISVAGGFSAVLTNDVVVIAMTPLLVSIALKRGLNPVPFLLGFCFAANTGSAATLIGSPQNMIAAQGLGLSFNGFVRVALVPAALSLPIVWGVVVLLYRGRWYAVASPPAAPLTPVLVDRIETAKAALVTLCVIAAFTLTHWPRELIALSAASVLLLNRQIASRDLIQNVDGNLLLMLMGLFVVNATLAATGLPSEILSRLQAMGLDPHRPLTLLLMVAGLSSVVGNNPAVMLLMPFLEKGAGADTLGAAIAMGTGFWSNAVVFGSLAGIIVVEQAAAKGITISLAEFSRAGAVVALACMTLAAAWIGFLSL